MWPSHDEGAPLRKRIEAVGLLLVVSARHKFIKRGEQLKHEFHEASDEVPHDASPLLRVRDFVFEPGDGGLVGLVIA